MTPCACSACGRPCAELLDLLSAGEWRAAERLEAPAAQIKWPSLLLLERRDALILARAVSLHPVTATVSITPSPLTLGEQCRTQVTRLSTQPVEAGGAEIAASHYAYDTRGRINSAALGAGPEARSVWLAYNAQGYVESMTDALSHTTLYGYDAAGRLSSETRPDGQRVTYAGNLTSLTPPGQPAHTFTYTPVDLMAQYGPPDANPGVDTTQYTFSADQQLTLITRPDGQTIAYGYDSAGRLHTETIARGTLTYGYDPATGNLTSMTAPGGIGLTYGYDGILLTTEAWSGPVAGTVARSYDPTFRLSELRINAIDPVAYSYDPDGLLVGAGALSLAYDAQNGLLLGSTLDTVTDTLAYNTFAERVKYRSATSGAGLYAVDYTRDVLGRITVLTETLGGVTDTYAYNYDLVGQLLSVTKNGAPETAYTYDSNGNRLTADGPGGTSLGVYDDQDRLTQYGSATYAYNAAGERQTRTASGQVTTYTYDALGNLMAIGLPGGAQITYLVDGQNRRIAKLVNGTRVQAFLYEDNLRIAAELD